MKKMLALVFSLVMAMTILIASVSSAETADLLSQIKERGYIIIATEGVGLDVEIGTAIAERLGVEARFEETNWDSILQGVDSGRFDLACNGVGYTETRAEKYSFSTPYVYTHKVLVVRKDNEEIKSFEDLKGKKTANTASSTYAAIAEEYGATVTGVDALADTLQLILQRRVDATINSQVTINDYMIAHPEAEIKVVDEGPGEPVAIPVRKADDTATLIAAINEALDAMRADGTLAAISIKYFNGLDLTGMPQE